MKKILRRKSQEYVPKTSSEPNEIRAQSPPVSRMPLKEYIAAAHPPKEVVLSEIEKKILNIKKKRFPIHGSDLF